MFLALSGRTLAQYISSLCQNSRRNLLFYVLALTCKNDTQAPFFCQLCVYGMLSMSQFFSQVHHANAQTRASALALFCAFVLCLVGCRPSSANAPLPTAVDANAFATSVVMTREAPPSGFDSVRFAQVDANTERLGGWHATFSLEFAGFFARTPRPASFKAEGELFYNASTNARRVVVALEGDLSESFRATKTEAVRLGDDAFLVRDGVCSSGREDALTAANLRPSDLIGGVSEAVTAYKRAVVNSEEVWRYAFTPAELVLPSMVLGDEGRILGMTGELWVAPKHRAVVRYYLNLDVDNVRLFGLDVPVTGTLYVRYELYDVGTPYNISVPFGC